MPSASQPLPPCPGRPTHDWRVSIGRTIRSRGTVETCRHCGRRRIHMPSGRLIHDA